MIELANRATVLRADLTGRDGYVLAMHPASGRGWSQWVTWRVYLGPRMGPAPDAWVAENGRYFDSLEDAAADYDARRFPGQTR